MTDSPAQGETTACAPPDAAHTSDGVLFARFEGANRVAYWIACLQRGPTGSFRHELFELRRRALRERDLVGSEIGRRRLAAADFGADLAAQARAEWKPTP